MWHSVAELQSQLNIIGFGPLKVDGVTGPQTEAAVVKFKRSIGFKARPYVGPLTERALFGTEAITNSGDSGRNPFWMVEAIRMKGLHEAHNRSALVEWFDKSVSWIDPREVPWCGAFVATCVRSDRNNMTIPKNPLGARNWGRWGKPVSPSFGSVLTFWRGSKSGWKGHVAFYWGEDDTAYHVLGGNQRNAVNVTRISKTRLLESRWANEFHHGTKPVFLTSKGLPLSTNES